MIEELQLSNSKLTDQVCSLQTSNQDYEKMIERTESELVELKFKQKQF